MLTFIQYIYLTIIGLLSGTVGGSLGTSGSNIIIPGLLVSGIAKDYKTASGTNMLVIMSPLTIGAVYTYYKAGFLQIETAIILMITYAIAATFAAIYIVKYVSNQTLILCYACYMFIVSMFFFHKYFNYKKETTVR
jgi:uncharacterized membrane protein YfcA